MLRTDKFFNCDVANDFFDCFLPQYLIYGHMESLKEHMFRISFFAGVFLIIAIWEYTAPRRRLTVSKSQRWFNNLFIISLNPLIIHLLFPIVPVGMAFLAQKNGWGLLNNIPIPGWLAVTASIVLLDFVVYFQHVIFHAVPLLWRLHMVHHTDMDIDLTTGLRFHPVEIILSTILKLGVIAVLGLPLAAVIAFEIILNCMAMFNHGNILLPASIDRILRFMLVTPDMHRVHHSVITHETNSNYGFNIAWWDRICGTYRSQPAEGHDAMTIGLARFRDPQKLKLIRLLTLPFLKKY